MPPTARAVIRLGRIELLEPLDLPEGTELVVALLQEDDSHFWNSAARSAIESVWDNAEDDVYGELMNE